MLRQCIEKCPDDLWQAGEHPRTFWRIAYHAAFYTHFYLSPTMDDFRPWERHQGQAKILWDDDETGLPPREVTYSQSELVGYIDALSARIDELVAANDLSSSESGFDWYPIPKLDHQLVSVRHLGTHVGQLQELLYARGIDLDWVAVA